MTLPPTESETVEKQNTTDTIHRLGVRYLTMFVDPCEDGSSYCPRT